MNALANVLSENERLFHGKMRVIKNIGDFERFLRNEAVLFPFDNELECKAALRSFARAVLRVGVKLAFDAILSTNRDSIKLCWVLPYIVQKGSVKDVSEALSFAETFTQGPDDAMMHETVMGALRRGDIDIFQTVETWFNQGPDNVYNTSDAIADYIDRFANLDSCDTIHGLARLLFASMAEADILRRMMEASDAMWRVKLAAAEATAEASREELKDIREDVGAMHRHLVAIAETQHRKGGLSDEVATVTLPAIKKADGGNIKDFKDVVDALRYHPQAGRRGAYAECKASFEALKRKLS